MAQQNNLRVGQLRAKRIYIDGVETSPALLLASGQVVDLNGEADALVIDADADTTISSPTDDQIDIEVAGADDFRITANTFTALSGSTIATNTIAETTAASGVTIDGVLLKDGIYGTIQSITGDGAITVQNALVPLSKATAAAITIVAPTDVTHDGIVIEVTSTTAAAHVITSSVDGFNAKGSSGTATFGGAKGDSVTLRAWDGHWWVVSKVNVTIA